MYLIGVVVSKQDWITKHAESFKYYLPTYPHRYSTQMEKFDLIKN